MSETIGEHFANLEALFRIAADMLEPDTSWPADEIAVVRDRLRRLADHRPDLPEET